MLKDAIKYKARMIVKWTTFRKCE